MSKLDNLTPQQKRALAKRLLAKKQALAVPSLLERLAQWEQQTPAKEVTPGLSYARLLLRARERAEVWQARGLKAGTRVRLGHMDDAAWLVDVVACLLTGTCLVQGLPTFEASTDVALETQWLIGEQLEQLKDGKPTDAVLLIWDGRTSHEIGPHTLARQLAFLAQHHPPGDVCLHLDRAFPLSTLLTLYTGGALSAVGDTALSMRFVAGSPAVMLGASDDEQTRVWWHPSCGGACYLEHGERSAFVAGITGEVVDAKGQVVADRMSGQLMLTQDKTRVASGYRVRKEGKQLRYLLNQDWVFPGNVAVARAFLSERIAQSGLGEHWWLVVDDHLILFAVIHEELGSLESSIRELLPARLQPQIVPVRRLPRDPAGYVDESALLALRHVPLDQLAQRQNTDVAVVATPFFKSPAAFEWRETQAEAAKSDVEAQTPSRSDVPAYAQGPELRTPLPANLNAVLNRVLADDSAGILHIDRAGREDWQTYAELKREAFQVLAGLEAADVGVGAPVLLMADDSRSYFTCLWACFLGGRVAVPAAIPKALAADHLDMRKLDHAHEVLAGAPIVCRQPLRMQLQRPELWQSTPRFLDFEALSATAAAAAEVESSHSSGAVMFLTSGSTGIPKLVQQGHGQLLAMAAGTVEMNAFGPTHKAINWMPLDHVGAVAFLHLTPMFAQASQVQVATSWIMQDPVRWLELIESQRAALAWAPNFAYGLLTGMGDAMRERVHDLSSMVFLVNAGEANVGRVMAQFYRLCAPLGLPENAIRPAFGMSETCSGITWSRGFAADRDGGARYISLGPPIPRAEVRIVDANGLLLHEGEIGRMQLRGPSVTPGYFANAARNAEVFVGDGWFDSGDLGYLLNGELVLTGREKEEIIVNGANFAAHDLEAHLEAHAPLEASYTAVLQTAQPEKLLVFAVPHGNQAGEQLFDQVRDLLLNYAGIVPDALVTLSVAQVPKTGIGKIQRSRLRDAFMAGDFAASTFGNQSDEKLPRWFYRQVWLPVQLVRGMAIEHHWWHANEPLNQEVSRLVIDLRDTASDLAGLLLRFAEWLKHGETLRRIYVITRGAFAGNATAAGVLAWWSSLAQESAQTLNVCCLDLPLDQLTGEDQAVTTFVNAVVPATHLRWDGRGFTTLALAEVQPVTDRAFWRPNKTYVIAGGAGGLGQVLAQHILSKGAKVLLIGRRPQQDTGLTDDGALHYAQVDICDDTALDTALAPHAADIAGIFHLAGTVEPQSASQLTKEAVETQLAAKQHGTANLCKQAHEKSIPLVGFSSTTAVFGFAGVSVYAAANAAMAAQIEATPKGLVIDWSVWREAGLNAGNAVDHLHDRHGLMAIDTALGLRSLDFLLSQNVARALVGLDAGHPQIRERLQDAAALETQRLLAFAETEVQAVTLKDWRGRDLTIDIRLQQPLPRTQDGRIDHAALATQLRPSQTRNQYQAPTIPLEDVICQIWCEILEQRRIGIDDHFFDVGGHSLQATRVMGRLSQFFRIEFAVKHLFSAPTIRQLAKALRQQEPRPGQLDKTIEIRKKIESMKQ